MKVLFVTNYPSPYRVAFFNLLGQKVDLTVVFSETPEEQYHRAAEWFDTDYKHFKPVFLKMKRKIGRMVINTDVTKELKTPYDLIIMAGYSSPTFIYAIEYMKIHKIPFYMEIDGGLIKEDTKIRHAIKKHLISSACGWISSGAVSDKYLLHYGANNQRIFHYPFSSLSEEDLKEAAESGMEEKKLYKEKLGINDKYILLYVGQFVYGKGIDTLIKAAKYLNRNIGIYIIGGEPSEEYKSLREASGNQNIHFLGFKEKKDLRQYYKLADALAMPTRGDVWGLVVNEALNFGLPVIATDKCVAALELVKNGYNGQIVPAEDPKALAKGIEQVFEGDLEALSQNAKNSVSGYSIEGMVKAHLELFQMIENSENKKRNDKHNG